MPHSPNASHEALPAEEYPFGFSPALPLPLSDNALAAADELYPLGSDTLGAVTSLRLRGFSPEESTQIISLAQARTRARTKFGEPAR